MKPVCNTHLLLVNRQWPLSNTLKPNKLVLTAKGEEDIMLEKQAAVDLTKLLEAINANGQIVQVSGYRDFAT